MVEAYVHSFTALVGAVLAMKVPFHVHGFTALVGAMFAINMAFSVWNGIVGKLVAATERRLAAAYAVVKESMPELFKVLERERLERMDRIADGMGRGQEWGLTMLKFHVIIFALAGFLPSYESPLWLAVLIVAVFILVSSLPLMLVVKNAKKRLRSWETYFWEKAAAAAAGKARAAVAKFVGRGH